MYRLLIVDDEPIIADGLFDELSLCSDLELDMYKAYSGRGALELLGSHRIDIVVTDIKMPGMDGMALLERIRDSWPQCRVIFLTGHREFDYVYRAIQYKGLQYVLKTEGYAKVISAVGNAIEDINHELNLSARMDEMRRKTDMAEMFMQKELLRRLLDGESVCEQDLGQCGIQLRSDLELMVVMGRLEMSSRPQSYAEFVRNCQTVRAVAEQYLGPQMTLVCTLDQQNDIIILAQPKKLTVSEPCEEHSILWSASELFVKETLELMQAAVKALLNGTISFGMLSKPVCWSDLPSAHGSVQSMMACGIGPGGEMLLTAEAGDPQGQRLAAPDAARLMKQRIETLAALLERNERGDYWKVFDNVAAALETTAGMQDAHAGEVYYSLALVLQSHLSRWQPDETQLPSADPALLLDAARFSSWRQAAAYLRQVSEGIFRLKQDASDRRASEILARLRTYIGSHLGEELSLLKLSEIMYFNPSYLSRLFKQLSGENLTDYIQQKRIERARELLGKNDLRINDIAVAVGFGSATNFTRFFKKATGMTPAEHRDRLSAGKAGIQM